jgi:hypothetical protein
VAVVRGSDLAASALKESEAFGLMQILKRVDKSVTPAWALPNLWCTDNTTIDGKVRLVTPGGMSIIWGVWCCYGTLNCSDTVKTVKALTMEFDASSLGLAGSVDEAIRVLPALDDELVAGLSSLPELRNVHLTVGSGTLLPQLAALSNLETLYIKYYCLRGTIPPTLVAGLPHLAQLGVINVERAVGATDPAGGTCGLSGTLPEMRLLGKAATGNTFVDLSFNQLTGQLPAGLLSLADVINLSHNHFTGSLPGVVQTDNVSFLTPKELSLNDNGLEVRVLHEVPPWHCE